MGRDFTTVLRDPVTATNTVLLGSDAPASARAMRAATRSMPPDLAAVSAQAGARLAPGLQGGRRASPRAGRLALDR